MLLLLVEGKLAALGAELLLAKLAVLSGVGEEGVPFEAIWHRIPGSVPCSSFRNLVHWLQLVCDIFLLEPHLDALSQSVHLIAASKCL